MWSSNYYLTQKMLGGVGNELSIGEYSKINQMIFYEYNNDFEEELHSKRNKAFWERGYYVETIGNITEELSRSI